MDGGSCWRPVKSRTMSRWRRFVPFPTAIVLAVLVSCNSRPTLEPFPPAAGWIGIAASVFTAIRLVSGAFERRIRRDLVEGTPTGWLIGSMWVITVAVAVAATAILIGNELLFWAAMVPSVLATLAYGVEYRINRKPRQERS